VVEIERTERVGLLGESYDDHVGIDVAAGEVAIDLRPRETAALRLNASD
jgi:hypothetical protein